MASVKYLHSKARSARLRAANRQLEPIVRALARCDHPLRCHFTLEGGEAAWWCNTCGVLSFASTTLRARAIALDTRPALAGSPSEPPAGDSDAKNVIPMKPRT